MPSNLLRLTLPSNGLTRPIRFCHQGFHPIRSHFPRTIAADSDSAMAAANSVRVAAAQMTSINDLAANFATCSQLVKEAASSGAKLVCFPETFSYLAVKDGEALKIAEDLDGPIMQRYCSLARCFSNLTRIPIYCLKVCFFRFFFFFFFFFPFPIDLSLQPLICRESNIWLSLGGFQEKGPDDSHMYNTHVVIDDAGNIRSTYRKIHLFNVDVPGGRSYNEGKFTEAGKDVVAVDSPVGRLGLSVCYDLRFPELYQKLRFQYDAQILLVPSAFTAVTGQAHWEILLRARAIETQCYVIASAQAGKHNQNRESYGDTLIIDPWGTVVGRLPDRLSTGITVADIDFSLIDSVRANMPIAEELLKVSGNHTSLFLVDLISRHSIGNPSTSGSLQVYDTSDGMPCISSCHDGMSIPS
ncbi:hypothetical protein FEM48_Zijuj03G0081400 [Ziziphus jujuba var. spinosa]|uniref:CN hydrolase domain-containing protein n=1 Tax=Ziziphus jujuba var. spinosa TaxID=714518 RepID=A0A978VP58_ZIZJJ|nr:hypothetical protein FEM48_Zijuj03G0081400 [Ziziphus jujuba var. spinosa]